MTNEQMYLHCGKKTNNVENKQKRSYHVLSIVVLLRLILFWLDAFCYFEPHFCTSMVAADVRLANDTEQKVLKHCIFVRRT